MRQVPEPDRRAPLSTSFATVAVASSAADDAVGLPEPEEHGCKCLFRKLGKIGFGD